MSSSIRYKSETEGDLGPVDPCLVSRLLVDVHEKTRLLTVVDVFPLLLLLAGLPVRTGGHGGGHHPAALHTEPQGERDGEAITEAGTLYYVF